MAWVRPSGEWPWPWRLFSCAGFLNEAVSMEAIDPLLTVKPLGFQGRVLERNSHSVPSIEDAPQPLLTFWLRRS